MQIEITENFFGRQRESKEVLLAMDGDGVFAGLPENTVKFILENYRTDVPYHNQVHVLYGLLWLHRNKAPLLAKLAWIGHDARHNGVKEESPEVRSAFITWQWLVKHFAWLVKNGIDPQDCTHIIDSTRFPYTDRNNKNHWVQWVRWADTLRIATGDTAQYLTENKVITDVDRFCAYFFESSQLFSELAPSADFTKWFPNSQKWFFQELTKSLRNNALCLRPEMDSLRDNAMMENFTPMKNFLQTLYGGEFLTLCFNFLLNDVTYPEFVDFVQYNYEE